MPQFEEGLLKAKYALQPAKVTFRELHAALPDLYPGISPSTTKGLPVVHNGLFSCAAHIGIARSAVKHAHQHFGNLLSLPPFPLTPATTERSHLTSTVLNGIFDLNLQLPSIFAYGDSLVPDEILERLSEELTRWIQTSLTVMAHPTVISASDISHKHIILMIRGFCFVVNHGSMDLRERLMDVYTRFVNTVSFISMHRYTRLIMSPLVRGINGERGQFLATLAPLTGKMEAIVEKWNEEFPQAASEVLVVRVFLLKHLLDPDRPF